MGLLDAKQTQTIGNSLGMNFTDYNGEKVRNDDAYMQNLSEGGAKMGISAQEYDKMINPSTYGARWGVAPSTTAPVGGSASSGGGGAAAPTGLLNATAPTMTAPAQATASTASTTNYTSSNADAVKALAKGYTASEVNVSPESTSQFQLNKMLQSGSPLMQQAETAGLQGANRRGLLNSSMAIGAAQDSMIRAATPFAQQDANTFANAGTFNASAKNTADQFGAGAANTAELQNAQAGTNVNLTNASEANKAAATNAAAANSASQPNAQLGTNVSLSNTQAKNTAALTDIDNQMKATLANLQANVSMSTVEKQLATQKAIQDAQNKTNILISQGNDATKVILNTADNARALGLGEMDVQSKMATAQLNVGLQTSLAEMADKNKALLQTNINAADMYKQYVVNLATISTSTSMNQEAKDAALKTQLNSLTAGLDAIGEVGKLDLGKYFKADTLVQPAAKPATAPTDPEKLNKDLYAKTDGGGD